MEINFSIKKIDTHVYVGIFGEKKQKNPNWILVELSHLFKTCFLRACFIQELWYTFFFLKSTLLHFNTILNPLKNYLIHCMSIVCEGMWHNFVLIFYNRCLHLYVICLYIIILSHRGGGNAFIIMIIFNNNKKRDKHKLCNRYI